MLAFQTIFTHALQLQCTKQHSIVGVQDILAQRLQDAERVSAAQAEQATAWAAMQRLAVPQRLCAAILAQQYACKKVLKESGSVAADIWEVLKVKDEEYVDTLQLQAQKTDELLQLLAKQTTDLDATCEVQLQAAEAALSEVGTTKVAWSVLIELS